MLTLANQGPPQFLGFEGAQAYLGEAVLEPSIYNVFKLPPVVDPDNDSYEFKVILGPALEFAVFDERAMTLSFNAT